MTESEIIEYLNFSDDNLSTKAKRLGYKKTTISCEGKRVSGWRKHESFFNSLDKLISYHKKFPLGFDCYYWSYQNKVLRNKNHYDTVEE